MSASLYSHHNLAEVSASLVPRLSALDHVMFYSQAVIGDYKQSARTDDHLGWLVCDGRPIDRTQYSAIFEVIGTSFGSTASNNFCLPDLRGRVLAGVNKTTNRNSPTTNCISSRRSVAHGARTACSCAHMNAYATHSNASRLDITLALLVWGPGANVKFQFHDRDPDGAKKDVISCCLAQRLSRCRKHGSASTGAKMSRSTSRSRSVSSRSRAFLALPPLSESDQVRSLQDPSALLPPLSGQGPITASQARKVGLGQHFGRLFLRGEASDGCRVLL